MRWFPLRSTFQTSMRRFLLPLIAAGLLVAPAADARDLTVAAPVARTCDDRLLVSSAGVAVERFRAHRAGLVTITLDGRRGDWDLAVFRPDGTLDTASATSGSTEKAVAYLRAGQELVAQACRRSGSSALATIGFDLYPHVPPARREPARLVQVPLHGAGDLARLEATGADVTHNHQSDHVDVVLYGAADERRLRRAGFSFRVLQRDLRELDAAEARKGQAFAARVARSALPSGRTGYRTYADYGTDLKALATANPGLVKPLVIGKSLEDRPIEGVEIAENVDLTDGRPVFATLGAHHAREWPSAEMPMEFAIDLVKRYRAGEQRVVDLLRRVRVIALPIINPDGFVVSRGANGGMTTDVDNEDPSGEGINPTLALAVADSGAYKRKNCRVTTGGSQPAAPPCALRQGNGVDLNRNYGAFWGGEGSSDDPTSQGYRGQAPYSEPEAEAVHRLSSTRAITTIISHHTYWASGIWLRQPGFCPFGPADCQREADVVPDEAGMKALGDAMGQATGWDSDLGWVIGEITGATEDWNYFAASAYGYTPEQRGPNFHPDFAQAVVAEYDGTGEGANGGVREALTRAAEQAGDPQFHSVLTGSATPGTVLKLVKDFDTATSQPDRLVRDHLEFATTVPASGTFEWHVNPSTRPLAPAKEHYVLRCEDAVTGALVQARRVEVDRGQALDLGQPCSGVFVPGSEQTTVFGAINRTDSSTTTTGTRPGERSAADRDLLVIARRSFRARTANRTRRVRVSIRVDGALRNLRVRLVAPRGRTVARGRLALIQRDRPLTLRFNRRIRPGVYRVVATAVARDGIVARATRRVLVRR